MLSINTNKSSLIAQNSMKSSTDKLNLAIERMTTGAKINHAKDNAANYSIITNYSTKLSALQVAEDNVNMGLDMLGTTSDILSQMEDNISKIRALAVQAQNGAYGSKSLKAMNNEALVLMTEISRLKETAQYNGVKLFNTGSKNVTNAGKELKLNKQGFLQEVVFRDTSTMTKISDVDETQVLAKGTYSVSTVDDLLKLHRMSQSGLLVADSEYVLANDIDFQAYCKSQEANGGWTPINLSKGILDGNGYTISNLYINRPNSSAQGLLANVSVNGVKNLKLENVDITGGDYVGGIIGGYVGATQGTLINCSVTGKIKGTNNVGGLMGSGCYSHISYCYADVKISGNKAVGGIVGTQNYSSVKYSLSKGSINGILNVGGIAGVSTGNADVTYNKSVSNVVGEESVGGISGTTCILLKGNYFGGSAKGEKKVGGIMGYCYQFSHTHTDNIIDGTISGTSDVGVFVGGSGVEIRITNSHYYKKNTGEIPLVGENCLSGVVEAEDSTIPVEYYLQVGTNSNSACSCITLTTYVDFSELSEILMTGIEDESILEKIDNLVNQVSLKQIEIGTAQNRLFGTLEEISTKYDNLVSSRSTIQDADIAEVSSEYIKMQILQQASATLMATANQSPAIALQLL